MKWNFFCSLSALISFCFGTCSLLWVFYPRDTSLDQHFDDIHVGMTAAEVNSVLGEPHQQTVWSTKVEHYWHGERGRLGVDFGTTGVVQHVWKTPILQETTISLVRDMFQEN